MTPGQRGLVLTSKESLYKGKPFKALATGLSSSGGRNNHGHVTSREKVVDTKLIQNYRL